MLSHRASVVTQHSSCKPNYSRFIIITAIKMIIIIIIILIIFIIIVITINYYSVLNISLYVS